MVDGRDRSISPAARRILQVEFDLVMLSFAKHLLSSRSLALQLQIPPPTEARVGSWREEGYT